MIFSNTLPACTPTTTHFTLQKGEYPIPLDGSFVYQSRQNTVHLSGWQSLPI